MNRENLEKLASYLEGLPADYDHFEMATYFRQDRRTINDPLQAPLAGACGTVACAIGHGPAAGIPAEETAMEGWEDYSDRVFELSCNEETWCFSSCWRWVDNTPHGAAKRIRYMLERGVPSDSDYQRRGWAPYMFAKEEA